MNSASTAAAAKSEAQKPPVLARVVSALRDLPGAGHQKRNLVLSVIDDIHHARQREVSFSQITLTLQKNGIAVGERTVRRTYKAWLNGEFREKTGS